jgi:hypothetical protein
VLSGNGSEEDKAEAHIEADYESLQHASMRVSAVVRVGVQVQVRVCGCGLVRVRVRARAWVRGHGHGPCGMWVGVVPVQVRVQVSVHACEGGASARVHVQVVCSAGL